jgi:nucleoside-diphosphate-sugar epimerase
MAKFSILGAAGFIGTHLCNYLASEGHEVIRFSRDNFPPKHSNIGHAIYCIGLTADFRTKLIETTRAHVCVLADVLETYRVDSLLYLSSTRVYGGAEAATEDASLTVRPIDADYVYNLSKLTGEAICLARGFRVARLSNVLGPGDRSENFVASVLRDARRTGQVTFASSPRSAKDYIDIDDVCRLLVEIAQHGKQQIYNVASGTAVDNRTIAALIEKQTRADVLFLPDAPTISFPAINIDRVKTEFGFCPTAFETTFNKLTQQAGVGL